MKSILEAGDLSGKKVLLRVDWSVPNLSNDYQIKVTFPTIEYLKKAGAKIILATHTEGVSIEELKQFVPEGIEILPNLRENAGEKENSEIFAQELAGMADIYVNEAFAVSHREHASIVGVPKLIPGFIGLRFEQEIKELSKVFDPEHPFLIILGGAKIETKLPLVEKFSHIADSIFIGGSMALKASEMGLGKNPKISFPTGDLTALDANQETIDMLKTKIMEAKLIVWNGPLGQYETGHTQYTYELAQNLAQAQGKVLVGGGDTLSVIKVLNLFDKFAFVSTGGGAMLDFLAKGTLPGLEAVSRQ